MESQDEAKFRFESLEILAARGYRDHISIRIG
jgi:hypothetical protein